MRPLLPRDDIAARLALIFPRGAFDPVMSSPLAAAAVAGLIYTDAVRPDDGSAPDDQGWARPTTVLWLSDDVYARDDAASRTAWRDAALGSKGRRAVEDLHESWGIRRASRWYADNSRETLRDETYPKWRQHGAVTERGDIPSTSSKPRWALTESFADLGPHGEDLDARVLAAVVAYETGADPEAVATQFGVAEWVTETLANGSRNTPPDPLKRVVELSKMVSDRVESRSRGA